MKTAWATYICPECKKTTKQNAEAGVSCTSKTRHKQRNSVAMEKK